MNELAALYFNILDLYVSDLPIYAQLPQNILLGLSELFFNVANFEFAYFAARRSSQALFMSLRFTAVGVASFIGSAYTAIFLDTTVLFDFKMSVKLNKFHSLLISY
jgi:hypothetical protein